MLASHCALHAIIAGILPRPATLIISLLRRRSSCYGLRLKVFTLLQSFLPFLVNRNSNFCKQHFSYFLFFLVFGLFFNVPPVAAATGQTLHSDLPAKDEIRMEGVTNEANGAWHYLRRDAKVETTEMLITADQIDYNSDTNWAYARGHVHMEVFESGDKLDADHAEYNLKTQEGRFYDISGTTPPKIMSSKGLLTTTNPFYFKARWADRIKNRYILHHGFLTDCTVPKPWWVFESPVFDVVPGERAIARRTVFRVKSVPLLYLPYFYKKLGKNPRQSGFLTPNFGNSSYRGYMVGLGYYWAINPSYDATYVLQYFTMRGPAHTLDFRGKPNDTTDFNFSLYGVQDKGLQLGNGQKLDESGVQFELTARTQVAGFTGRLDYNYLSSFLFRVSFANSFVSALSSEVDSVGYLQRHFKNDSYALDISFQRNQLFESITPTDQVTIQKLPSVEFSSRDRKILGESFPVWFSFDSSGQLLGRQEQTVQTGLVVPRIDLEPRVMTEFDFKGFSLVPSMKFGVTDYGNSYSANSISYSSGCFPVAASNPNCSASLNVALANANLFRHNEDFSLEFGLPTLEKVYTPPKWLHLGTKVKHTIDGRATYEYVTGIENFQKVLKFDDLDYISNTNQLTLSLTNRLYKKDKSGHVSEFLSWQVAYARYFDPTFGGAVQPNQRNMVLAEVELTPFPFLYGPRTYSPVNSSLRLSPYNFLSVEWQTDYDPIYHKFVDNTIAATVRKGPYFVSVGDTSISTNPLLIPQANQIRFGGGYGSTVRKGWNAAVSEDYDYLQHTLLYQFGQLSYNTNCCGFSIQYRRFSFGTGVGARHENQYLLAFQIANLGSFGTMQKQDRIF